MIEGLEGMIHLDVHIYIFFLLEISDDFVIMISTNSQFTQFVSSSFEIVYKIFTKAIQVGYHF